MTIEDEVIAATGDLMARNAELEADAALGAAWRRAEAALPKGWQFRHAGPNPGGNPGSEYFAVAIGPEKSFCPSCGHADDRDWANAFGPTPTAALNALADRLEKEHP